MRYLFALFFALAHLLCAYLASRISPQLPLQWPSQMEPDQFLAFVLMMCGLGALLIALGCVVTSHKPRR